MPVTDTEDEVEGKKERARERETEKEGGRRKNGLQIVYNRAMVRQGNVLQMCRGNRGY